MSEVDVCIFTIGCTAGAVFAVRCAERFGVRPLEGVVSCIIQESCMYAGAIAGRYMSEEAGTIRTSVSIIVGLWLGISVGLLGVEAMATRLNFSSTSVSNPQYLRFASLAGLVSSVAVAFFLD